MIEFLVFIQQLLSSGSHIVAKDLMLEVPAPYALFFRALIATSVYFTWIVIIRRKKLWLDKKDIWRLVILGLINIPTNQFLFLTSAQYTTAPNISLAYALTPVFVFIIAAIFLKEKVSILKILGIAVAFGGTLIILFEQGLDFKSDYFLGNILVLTASLSWGLYTIIGKSFTRKYGAIYSSAMTTTAGFFFYIPIFLLYPIEYDIGNMTLVNFSEIAYLGIATSVVAYALWYYALKKIEASKLAVFNNLQPVLTTIMAVIFLSHEITVSFVIGGLTIIAGVIMTQKG